MTAYRVLLLCCLLLIGAVARAAEGGAPSTGDGGTGDDPEIASAAALESHTPSGYVRIVRGIGAGPWRVSVVEFAGNRVTRRETMVRELDFQRGDLVSRDGLDAGRQAIVNLGLFRQVDMEVLRADHGVRVIYTVRERWYVLPAPRVDANSDGDLGFGSSLSWNNFLGRNHKLSASYIRKKVQEADRDDETTYSLSYEWRRVAGSRANLLLFGSDVTESAFFDGRDFNESTRNVGFLVSQQLTSKHTGQGWVASGGMRWRQGSNSGSQAPEDDGTLTSLIAGIGYRDMQSQIYSEEGRYARLTMETQISPLSDYDEFLILGAIGRFFAIGDTPHQNINLKASVGSLSGGPDQRRNDTFSLGGAIALRGFDSEYAEGDAFWLTAVEYLRPLYWDWLRGLILLEAGNAMNSNLQDRDEPVLFSVGVGVRIRVTWLVDTEIELGWAWPLNGGDGGRVFAGGVE